MRFWIAVSLTLAACAPAPITPGPVTTVDVELPHGVADAPRVRETAVPVASAAPSAAPSVAPAVDPALRRAALEDAARYGMLGLVQDVDAGAPPPPPPTPLPAIAGPDLAPVLIQSVVRQSAGRMRSCYEAALAKDPKLTGRVSTRFEIGVDGHVTRVIDAGSDPALTSVASCVRKVYGGLVFPKRASGVPVVVAYPIVFSPAP